MQPEPSLSKCLFNNSATEYGIIYIENRRLPGGYGDLRVVEPDFGLVHFKWKNRCIHRTVFQADFYLYFVGPLESVDCKKGNGVKT